MVSARLLVFFSLQVLSVFGFGNNLVADWPHLNENLDWQHEKLNSLVQLLETLTEIGNVTIIGWQNVWNTDGSLSEIRMIELTLLKETPVSHVSDPVDMKMFEELPMILEMMHMPGNEMITSSSIQQWTAFGNIQKSLYLHGQDVHILTGDDVMIWYKKMTAPNMAHIQEVMKQMHYDMDVGMNILKWNEDGTFNMADSVIVPELLSSVVDATNANHEMLTTSLMGVTKSFLLHPEDVTKNMVHYMKQHIPGYMWHVIEGSNGLHIDNDVYMSFNYGIINMLEGNVVLDIYGMKM